MKEALMKRPAAIILETGKVHCTMCTHTVDAQLEHHPRYSMVKPGQKCPRCAASLDAAWIMRVPKAA
jgi:uncharacterized protein (UPF0212 family)